MEPRMGFQIEIPGHENVQIIHELDMGSSFA